MNSTFQQRAERLKDRIDAPEPQTWRPDDDSLGHPRLLIGELVSVSEGTTSWGERQIAVVKDAEGTLWSVWLLHHVLIGEFVRQQPKIGELLAIRYEGRVEPERGSAYEKYRLMIDRPGAAVEWKEAGAAARDAAAAPAPQPAPAAPVQQNMFAGEPPPAPPEPPPAQTDLCEACGFANGYHAAGCPNDIPF